MNSVSQQICREIIRHNSKSFYLASQLLPKRERAHATVVYAWCRRADDVVDEGNGDKRLALTGLGRELDDIDEGRRTSDPIVDAFGDVVRQCQIPMLYPRELLLGMASDLGSVCYQTVEELLEYCYRVASTVGLIMCHVTGVGDDDALANAAHLGVAMQLTNICRDVVEDWTRGRLYVPLELLEKNGVSDLGASLGQELPSKAIDGLATSVHELLGVADRYYRSGDAGLEYLPWRSSVAIAAARNIYAEIGCVLFERECQVVAGRAVVSQRRKLQLAGQSLLNQAMTLPLRFRKPSRFHSPTRQLAYSEMPRL
jgi:phytoene synthase